MRSSAILVALAAVVAAGCVDEPSSTPTAPVADAKPEAPVGFVTARPAQARALLPQATVMPLLSSGDILPGSGLPWAPTPDGLGAYLEDGKLYVFANHELSAAGVTSSDGGTPFQYSRVSKLALDPSDLSVVDGSYVENGSSQLIRLCSATWVNAFEGFPTGYFLTGEEQGNTANGSVVSAYTKSGARTALPQLGAFSHENTIGVPGFEDGQVVLMGFDDTAGASELYMYVAADEAAVFAGTGKLYVMKTDALSSGGNHLHSGNLAAGDAVDAYFAEIADPADLGAAASTRSTRLQTKVDVLGAMPFVRIEDGDYDKNSVASPALYFVDTGSSSTTGRTQVGASCGGVCDLAGSIYRIEWKSGDPLGGVTLRLLARSAGVAAGWASPDNIATTRKSMMLQEDPAYTGFDGSRAPAIWNFNLIGDGKEIGEARKVAEATQETLIAGDAGKCVDALGRCWETSGIISTEDWLGAGTWLFDVQAHTLPFTVTSGGATKHYSIEGGQLLYLRLPGS